LAAGVAEALSNESCGRFLPRVAETDEDVPRVHRKKELVSLSCTRYQSVQRPVRNTLICSLQAICSTMGSDPPVVSFFTLPTSALTVERKKAARSLETGRAEHKRLEGSAVNQHPIAAEELNG